MNLKFDVKLLLWSFWEMKRSRAYKMVFKDVWNQTQTMVRSAEQKYANSAHLMKIYQLKLFIK